MPRASGRTRPAALRRLARVLLVVGALLFLTAGPASAHANLERSDPPNGGQIAPGRTTLTLWFGEPVTAAGSSFSVQRTDGAAPAVETTSTLDEGGTVVHLTIPPLENGTYTLTWAVTATDGHPTRGTVVFGSGFRPDGIASADTSAPDAGAVALRVVDLGGSLVALGSLVVAGRVIGALGGLGPVLRRRVLTAGALGATVALVGALATPVLTASAQLGDDGDVAGLVSAVQDLVLTSTWGILWALRVVALLVAYVFLWRSRRDAADEADGRATPSTWVVPGRVAAVALAAGMTLDAWAGHASTLQGRSVLTSVAAALHVLAASVWAGGLVVLVLAVVPVMRLDGPERRAVTPAVWRAFSPVAAMSVAVLAATGFYEAARHTGTLATLDDGLYGRSILVKVGLLGVALALAGYNTLVVNDRIAERVGAAVGLGSLWRPRGRALRRTVVVEAVVLLCAVGVAAVMTSTPTAREVAAASQTSAPHTDTVDGLFITAEAVPTGTRLRVVVRTEAVLRPMPWPVTGVEVGFLEGTVLNPEPAVRDSTTLDAVDDGLYEASVADPGLDEWTAQVVVHRTGKPDDTLLLPGTSATGAEPVSPLELAAGSVALLLLAGTGTAVVLTRRRRGDPQDDQDDTDHHTDATALQEAISR
jgi:copper transport protein